MTKFERCLNDALREWRAEAFLIALNETRRNLTGPVLKVDTGRLRASVGDVSRVNDTGYEIGTNVAYGMAHEFGATVKSFTVVPKNARALRFIDKGGALRFSKGHVIPERRMPERSFARKAVKDTLPRQKQLLRRLVRLNCESTVLVRVDISAKI